MSRRVLDAVCLDSQVMDLVRTWAAVYRVTPERFVTTAIMDLAERAQAEKEREARGG